MIAVVIVEDLTHATTTNNGGFYLDQTAMIQRLLMKHNITGKRSTPCKSTIRFLNADPTDTPADLTEYQSKIGALNFLIC